MKDLHYFLQKMDKLYYFPLSDPKNKVTYWEWVPVLKVFLQPNIFVHYTIKHVFALKMV